MLPLGSGVNLIQQHACGLIALEKPEGIKSHPNKAGKDSKALLVWRYDLEQEAYLDSATEERFYLLNRLDSPTSGILLLATNPELATVVKAAFAGKHVEKTYYAVVKGRPIRNKDVWRDRLQVGRHGAQLRVKAGTGTPSVTEMQLQWSSNRQPVVSLLELRPLTGRTHQLRVQCAQRQMPILGDATYGDFGFNRHSGSKRLFLHSAKIRLNFIWKGAPIEFRAESRMPESFSLWR